MVDSQLHPAVSDKSHAAPPAQDASVTDVLGEFASSFWRSGVQKPLEGAAQVVGLKTDHVQTEDNVHGWMKAANVAGNAAGQLCDMGLLGLGVSKVFGLGKAVDGLCGVEGLTGRSIAANATTGALYGGVFTPLNAGESQWHRLANATTDAGSFAALGAANSGLKSLVGDGLLTNAADHLGNGLISRGLVAGAAIGDRAFLNLGSGAAAGFVDTQLDANTHGKLVASGTDYLNGMAGWAVGNAVLGEASHDLMSGAQMLRPVTDRVGKFLKGDVSDGREHTPPYLDLRSMKEFAEATGDETKVRALVEKYLPALKKAFPLEGETEDLDTYVRYIMDKGFPWDMVQLHGPVQGGVHYQIMDVGGDKFKKVGWLEHIWTDENTRKGGYGSALFNYALEQVDKRGDGASLMWEFNNPDKMTRRELREDKKGGITTQDRVDYWAKRGAYVAVVPSTGEIAPYAQPGMDGQPEVNYLSQAWAKKGGFAPGETISKEDYKKVQLAAHSTITDVDTDPTVKRNMAEIDALPDQEFVFMKLSDYIQNRAQILRDAKATHDARLARWQGDDINYKGEPLAPATIAAANLANRQQENRSEQPKPEHTAALAADAATWTGRDGAQYKFQSADPVKDTTWHPIYESEFPAGERQPYEFLESLSAPGSVPHVELQTTERDGKTAAFTITSDYGEGPDGRRLLMPYIGVDKPLQSSGIGSQHLKRVLENLKQEYPTAPGMILEMEPTDTPGISPEAKEQREKRLRFWERNGAREVKGVNYEIPSSEEGEPPIPLKLMWIDFGRGGLTDAHLKDLVGSIYKNGYELPDNDPLVTKFMSQFDHRK